MIAALVLALGLVAAQGAPVAQDPGSGTIRGQVRSESTGALLSGAAVEVHEAAAASSRRVVVADSAGGYVLRGVAAGRRVLRASYVGYEPLEVEVLVAPGSEVRVDLSLRLRPVPLVGIMVKGRVNPPERDTAAIAAPALGLAGLRALEAAPGIVELGLGDGPRGAPGQAPVDPSDVLFVRGVPSDLKLVLLDGAPVFTPFHIGGLLESFDAQVLRDATLYLGGAPARYDGGLSYILDLSTRAGRGDRLHSSGALDLMSARMTAEGAAGSRLRYLVGGRGVHGFGVDPFLRGDVPFAYAEGIARLDAALDSSRTLSLMGFRNDEGVSLDSLGNGIAAGWGNTALSLRFRGPLGEADSELTAAFGSFAARMPTLGERSFPALAETQRLRLTADFARSAGELRLRYGASVDRLWQFQEVVSRPSDPEPRSWTGEVEGTAAGTYLEAAWQPAPRLRLRGGLRSDVFFADPGLRLAPRLSLTWMLGERAALTAAAGRYHQYVRTSKLVAPLQANDSPDTLFLPTGLAVDQATHFNLALHQELDDGLRLGVEGFFKTFAGDYDPLSSGTHASGLDLWVRRDAGRYRGWLGYSLTWVWAVPTAQTSSEQFVGRHLLNLGLGGPLGRVAELDLRFAYGAGLPFSAIPFAGAVESPNAAPAYETIRLISANSGTLHNAADAPLLPQAPADPYLRLDVGLSRTFTTRWRGNPVELSPYLKVLNSLDRRDALFYWADREGGASPRAVAALPVLPVAGFEWRF